MSSLAEYAAQNGIDRPPVKMEYQPTYQDKLEQYEEVERIKAGIVQQLEEGQEPESILYLAIFALSRATCDDGFLEKASPFLSGNKDEQSLFLDLDAMQAKRLERRKAYFDKRRREVQRQIKQLEADQAELLKELDSIPKIN
jgi:hypothetical protein